MAYPTITERYGSLSATGVAKEVVFGTPVAATTWLPMTGNTMETDPGWFSPEVMEATRDLHVYNLYGQAHYTGAIDGPFFPDNAAVLLSASIGMDAQPGAGVTGATGTGSTTLSGGLSVGATAVTLTSASTFADDQIIQIDVNNPATPTTAECVKIVSGGGTTSLVITPALQYAHLTGAAVVGVVAPYTHTFSQTNTLPSLTVEKNLGGYQSLQFAGCKVGKLSIKAPATNEAVSVTYDVTGRSAAILTSPTAVSIIADMPFVFAEATLTLFSNARNDVSSFQVDIDNGLKETYTYSGQHGPSFITPVTVHASGTLTVVFSSLNDATYGDYSNMVSGTLGSLVWTATHPVNNEAVTITLPQVVLSKLGQDVKMTDVIMSNLTYEATKSLSAGYTIRGTLVNNVYTAY
jgi:hypothetical protein